VAGAPAGPVRSGPPTDPEDRQDPWTWSEALSAEGYVLQVADSPEGPWQDYTGGTAVIDGSNVALMHVSGGTKKFFRLHKP
jgi:hypothetical protein